MSPRSVGPVSRPFRLASLAFPLLFSGCGGGGGGGGGGTPPAPPPPIETVPLVITAGTATDIGSLSISGGEGLLQLGEMAVDFAKRAAESSALSYSASCPNGGVLDALLIDPDQSGRPSPGDTVRVTLRDCYLNTLEDIGVGEFAFVLDAPASGARSAYSGTLTFSPGFGIVTQGSQDRLDIAGSLRVEWRLERLQTLIRVASTTADDLRFTAQVSGLRKVERFHRIDASKTLRYDSARSLVRFSFTYDSQTLAGRLEVRTPSDFSAFFNTYPDQGRVTITGANNSQVLIEPNFVVNSELARVRFDATGDGTYEADSVSPWQQQTDGYLWWEPISVPASGQRVFYQTRAFNVNDFGILFTVPVSFGGERVSVRPEVVIQLTRELAAGTSLAFEFRTADGRGEHNVPANVEIDGARISIVPQEQLEHGRSYFVENTSGTVRDRFGNTLSLGNYFGVDTRNDLQAVARASGPLAFAGTPLALDARDSTSVDGPVARYRWRQVSGTPAGIANPDAPLTTIAPGLAPVSGEVLVFEVEITNRAGEYDRERVSVQSFQSASQGSFFHMRSSPGDYIGGGVTALFSSATGDFTATSPGPGGLSIWYNERPAFQSYWWSLEFVAAGNAPLAIGRYEDAQRSPFQDAGRPGLSMFGTGRGCNQLAGRFEIFELERDANGNVTRLALDFEQRCEITGPPLFGSIRVNSTRPLAL